MRGVSDSRLRGCLAGRCGEFTGLVRGGKSRENVCGSFDTGGARRRRRSITGVKCEARDKHSGASHWSNSGHPRFTIAAGDLAASGIA
jgi:hypothetical protein